MYENLRDGVYIDLESHHTLLLPSHSVDYNESFWMHLTPQACSARERNVCRTLKKSLSQKDWRCGRGMRWIGSEL